MRQLFKIPLEAPCDCMACRKGLFSPLVMPFQAYQEMSALPLPTPQQQASTGTVRDLHYITLEQAMTRPFTAEHQPSLINRKAARASNAHAGVSLAGWPRDQERLVGEQDNTGKVCPGCCGVQGVHEAPLHLLYECTRSDEATWH